MERFETYLRALAEFDYSFHEELQGGLNWLASKKREKAEREKRRGRGRGKGNSGVSGEESSSLEENGTTSGSGTDIPSSEDAGVFPGNLADFMSGGDGTSEEFDETSEVAVKLKVRTWRSCTCSYLCMYQICVCVLEGRILLACTCMCT